MAEMKVFEQNPVYHKGLWFEKGFYKNNLEANACASKASLNRSLAVSIVVEVAKKVALVALVVIPSFVTLGSTAFVAVFFTGITAGILDESITSSHSVIKRVFQYSELNAHLKGIKQLFQPMVDFFGNSAIPITIFRACVFAGGRISSFAIYSGAFFAGKILANDIMALGLDLTERRANAHLANVQATLA